MILSAAIVTPAAPADPAAGSSVVLTDVSWDAYEKILEAFAERRLRHTYVDGMLEIMSPLRSQEWRKGFIGRLIETMAWRLGI